MASLFDKIKHAASTGLKDVEQGAEWVGKQYVPGAYPFHEKAKAPAAVDPQVTLPPDIQKWVGLQAQAKTYQTQISAMLQKSGLSKKDADAAAGSYITNTWLPQQMAGTTGSQGTAGGDLAQMMGTLQKNYSDEIGAWNKAYQGDVNTGAKMLDSLKGQLPASMKALGPLFDNLMQADRGLGDATAAQMISSPNDAGQAAMLSKILTQLQKNALLDQQGLVSATGPSGSTGANPFA